MAFEAILLSSRGGGSARTCVTMNSLTVLNNVLFFWGGVRGVVRFSLKQLLFVNCCFSIVAWQLCFAVVFYNGVLHMCFAIAFCTSKKS